MQLPVIFHALKDALQTYCSSVTDSNDLAFRLCANHQSLLTALMHLDKASLQMHVRQLVVNGS